MRQVSLWICPPWEAGPAVRPSLRKVTFLACSSTSPGTSTPSTSLSPWSVGHTARNLGWSLFRWNRTTSSGCANWSNTSARPRCYETKPRDEVPPGSRRMRTSQAAVSGVHRQEHRGSSNRKSILCFRPHRMAPHPCDHAELGRLPVMVGSQQLLPVIVYRMFEAHRFDSGETRCQR